MSVFTKLAQGIFSPVDENGNARSIAPTDAQVWGTELERLTSAVAQSVNASVIRGTLEDLNAVAGDYADGEIGLVVTDPVEAVRGVYKKILGVWVKQGDLPQDLATAAANQAAIDAARAASDRAAAEIAKNIAEGYASDAVSQGSVPIYATLAGISGLTIPVGISLIRVNGNAAAGDFGDGLYKSVSSEPSHAGKGQSAGGVWWELVERSPRVQQFNLPASGDQTAAFNRLETYASGKVVDLLGQTYTVTAAPNQNTYINGYFSISNMVRSTLLFNEPAPDPVFQTNGSDAIGLLRRSLGTPAIQTVGIVLIGDSITWGATLPDMAVTTPRDGTLSDPRDNFITASWANELKRWVGANYAPGISPVLSNWPASPSGQAIATWTVPFAHQFPANLPFTTTITGGSTTATNVAADGSVTGFQYNIQIGQTSSTVDIDFVMTGTMFEIFFTALAGETLADVEIFTDGVSRGTFSTSIGQSGIVAGVNQKLRFNFPYIRSKNVRLRVKYKSGGSGTSRLRLESINFPKVIRVTNQGINGATARSYPGYNLAGNNFGDGVAVSPEDEFIFVQMGTNDRGIRPDTPMGTNVFQQNYRALLDALTPLGSVITMVANKVAPAEEEGRQFTMRDVRRVAQGEAKRAGIPCIDNYALFDRIDLNSVLADNLHPNRRGHAMIARNVIGAIEAA